MRLPIRALLLSLGLACSACSKDADARRPDAGSELAEGNTSSESGAGGNTSSEPGAGGATAGKAGVTSAAESGQGGSAGADADGCSADCEAGEHCELVQVTCVRAPCPPLPMCVPDATDVEPKPADCDPRKIMCKRTAPECPEGQAPSVDGSCYGPCVDIHACQCAGPEACPLPEKFTCNMSAKHCTPYLR